MVRHCATSRDVAGPSPDEVTELFQPHYGPGLNSVSNLTAIFEPIG
jgi:hypothetical protein